MSVRDRQWLGVLGSVSVRTKRLMSRINSEVSRLSYPLWSLAGRHIESSVTALFSSRSINPCRCGRVDIYEKRRDRL